MPEISRRFHLDRMVGVGVSAEVWLARTREIPPRRVVIKRLRGTGPASHPPSFAVRELRALSAVHHPRVLRPLDVLADPPGIALVLPYLAGGSVRDLLGFRGALEPGEAAAVVAGVAAGLAALHLAGFIHGDLKPDNILLTGGGNPVVADAGLARVRGSRPGLPVVGTPAYLAPEVAAGAPVDVAADVFALAATAYELLSGEVPHPGPPAQALLLARRGAHQPLTTNRGLPVLLARVVERGLDADPTRRLGDPVTFSSELLAAVAPASVRLPRPGPALHHRRIELPPPWARTVPIGPV